MREIYRILDANLNRAREALRVAEDCGRFALNDPAVTAMAKNMRSDLKILSDSMPRDELLASRDTAGDIGTEITSPSEKYRADLTDVATAAMKRLGEALRTIEEYSKIVAPDKTLLIERLRYNAYTLEQRLIGRLLVGRRFTQSRLYVLITSSMCHGSVRETAREAIAGGADVIQLRETDIDDDQFLAVVAELRELTDEPGKVFIVNNRADIAAIVGADGVHLGQHDLPIGEVRRLLRPGAIVGRSTHSIAQVKAAATEGADYISVGPVFETTTKDAGPTVSIKLLKQALDETELPVVAIGGINTDSAGQLIKAGVKCLAVCSAIITSGNPKAETIAIKKQFTCD